MSLPPDRCVIVPVDCLESWAQAILDETGLDAVREAILRAAHDEDAGPSSLIYSCLSDGAASICCPVCDGSGDDEDFVENGTCGICEGTGEFDARRLCDVAADLSRLAPTERAVLATREALTEQARREVHMVLSAECRDDLASHVWHKLAIERVEENK